MSADRPILDYSPPQPPPKYRWIEWVQIGILLVTCVGVGLLALASCLLPLLWGMFRSGG